MKILLTNDDGIHAEGLRALYELLKPKHSITVVAPDRERSAVGHGITLDRPIRAEKIVLNGGWEGFAVTGTPADCIKLAIVEILKTKPELVISGINPGANVGVNINYSGTVAAAREAALYGIPAIAVSVQARAPKTYLDIAGFIRSLAEDINRKGLPAGTFLNVNFPDTPIQQIAGIRISRQGIVLFSEYFEKRIDPRNRIYYWQGSDVQPVSDDPDIDGDALSQNYISITPIKCDMTDYNLLNDLKSWALSMNHKNSSRSGSAS
jgi:5'-nucleotidase